MSKYALMQHCIHGGLRESCVPSLEVHGPNKVSILWVRPADVALHSATLQADNPWKNVSPSAAKRWTTKLAVASCSVRLTAYTHCARPACAASPTSGLSRGLSERQKRCTSEGRWPTTRAKHLYLAVCWACKTLRRVLYRTFGCMVRVMHSSMLAGAHVATSLRSRRRCTLCCTLESSPEAKWSNCNHLLPLTYTSCHCPW
mmetsp:Transcript_14109/g.27102  ORF Transcript_14109/g.27102 Transcript_14109/m.27102 type:complete len:201 (-) Transcript_14109:43-645(-)